MAAYDFSKEFTYLGKTVLITITIDSGESDPYSSGGNVFSVSIDGQGQANINLSTNDIKTGLDGIESYAKQLVERQVFNTDLNASLYRQLVDKGYFPSLRQ